MNSIFILFRSFVAGVNTMAAACLGHPAALLARGLGVAVLLAVSGQLWAQCYAREGSPQLFDFVGNNNLNYCELCGYGYMTAEVRNPFMDGGDGTSDPDMEDIEIEFDLGSTGLQLWYGGGGGVPEVSYSFNGGGFTSGGSVSQSGNVVRVTNLPTLNNNTSNNRENGGGIGRANTLRVRIAVHRPSNPEGLEFASKNVSARLVDFEMQDNCSATNALEWDREWSFPGGWSWETDPYNEGAFNRNETLDYRSPNLDIAKWGWNYDAGQRQSTQSDTVYGHNDDDVVWRIRIRNNGNAPVQDLRLDDVISDADLMEITHICASQGSANTVAANNGAGMPGDCEPTSIALGNPLNNYVVEPPFGAGDDNLPYENGDLVDANPGQNIHIYMVGKIYNDASCRQGWLQNDAQDVEYGCEAQPGPGGLNASDTGDANMYTRYGETDGGGSNIGLRVKRRLTGLDSVQPVGARGLMTITLRNEGRGTVYFDQGDSWHLRDVLPPEYVMDPTFTPQIVAESQLYGNYEGRIDTLEWINRAGGLPLNGGDSTTYLNNTAPEFRLSSSTIDSDADQAEEDRHLMRHGDELTFQFRVVLIDPDFYDLSANLDVLEEDVISSPEPNTDPSKVPDLENRLYVQFRTLCAAQGLQEYDLRGNNNDGSMTGNSLNNYAIADQDRGQVPADPEDLDINIDGQTFILTNDRNQRLPLRVMLTNNGGHDAEDFQAFVTFGATMEIVSSPGQCSVVPVSGSPIQPAPWKTWVDPVAIPSTATVYRCDAPSPVSPGQTVNYDFEVIKTNDPAGIAEDDLTFRADVVGEIFTANGLNATGAGLPLWFPAPGGTDNLRGDGEIDRGNNYSLDTHWARVIGFNLIKDLVGTCNENVADVSYDGPASGQAKDRERVQIGEECTWKIETGGWFGFETPGFSFISVQNIQVRDQVPDGQSYISNTDYTLESTSLITGVTRDVSRSPLEEGEFGWRFNVPDSTRIEVADEWFILDTVTRILNKPQDDRNAPNVHAANRTNVLDSTFDAAFFNENTQLQENYTLGSGLIGAEGSLSQGTTTGYPEEPIRRADVIVTEPLIEVEKQVCNETLYGAGPGCSNWVDLTDEGDTFHSYIFRLTVSNRAADDGQPRAPAYDLELTDNLDASDLMLVVDFATDGLDNDGDGLVDGADTDGEGSVADNVVLNGTPAVITFSHLHGVDGTGLRRIEPGSSVELYYRVDPDERAAPQQVLTNRFSSLYDSLEGSANEHGQQTVTTPGNGELGGARQYNSAEADAAIEIIPLLTQPKEILRLSQTPLGQGSPQEVTPGEEIEYRLLAELPVAVLRNLVVEDQLPAGLTCAEAPVVDLSQPPYAAAGFKRPDLTPVPPITPSCSGTQVRWDFGDVTLTSVIAGQSRFEFPLTFIARVDNSAGNNDGTTLTNGFPATTTQLSYENQGGATVVLTFDEVAVEVKEADVSLDKVWVEPVDGGDLVDITITATNNGTAPAYNLRVWEDLLDSEMTFIAGSVSGTDPPDVVDTTTYGPNRPVFVWQPANPLAPGASRTFTFQVRVDDAVQPLQMLQNLVRGDSTSLPGQGTALNSTGQIGADGAADGQRIGSLDSSAIAPNDYEAISNTVQATVGPLALTKTDLDPAMAPEIGAHKAFQLDILLPEGTTQNLQIQDFLNSGAVSYLLADNADFDITYDFTGIASINGAAPSEAAMNAVPVDGASGAVLWDLGTVVTATEDDLSTTTLNPQIRITYYGRINNDLNTDRGDTLGNGVQVNYTHGQTGAPAPTLNDSTALVNAIESDLSATKNYTNISGGQLTGGTVLEYTVTLNNNGNATAYDLNIVDTLPAGLTLDSSFTPTATINGSAVAGFVSAPADGGSGQWIWGRDNADGSLDLPAGQELVLTYRVVIGIPGGTFTNSMNADWTSLQDVSVYERTGAGCPAITAPDDYCISAQVTTADSSDDTAVSKAFLVDTWAADGSLGGDGRLRVGDSLDYQLTLTLNESTTRNVVLSDVLPAGMEFDRIVSVNGDNAAPFDPVFPFTHAPLGAPSVAGDAASGQTVTFSLGDVGNANDNNSANNDLVLVYRARVVEDVLAHQATLGLDNAVTLSYATLSGDPVPLDPSRMQDTVGITVDQPLMSDVVKTERNGRTSPYNVMDLAGETMAFRLETQNNGDAPAYDLLISGNVAYELDESTLTTPVVSIDGTPLAAADFVFTPPATRGGSTSIKLNVPVMPGGVLTIDYDIGFHTDTPPNTSWSHGAGITEYWSLPATSGQRYAPVAVTEFVMSNPATLAVPVKTLVTPTTKAVVGEEVEYTITVPGATLSAALSDVQITDTLNSDLEFVSATVNDPAFGLTDNGSAAQNVDLSLTQIPAGQQAEITLVARVVNTADSNAGDSFVNTASYTFNGNTLTSSATAALTIAEPQLTLSKDVTAPASISAGTLLDYSVQVTAATGANAADAHDLTLTDTLDIGLVYEAGSASLGDPDTITGDGINTPQVLTWNVATLAEGGNLNLTYQAAVQDSVGAGQTLNNTLVLRWTSLAGSSAFERTGSETPAFNDYVATDSSQVATTDSTAFSKQVVSDTYLPDDDGILRVGDRVNFALQVALQEGSHTDLVVTDTLPAGMAFEQVVSVDQFGTAGTLAAPAVSGQTVTFDIGDITNPVDGDASNDVYVITYQARVLNLDALNQQPLVQTLANSAELAYTLVSGPVTPVPATASIAVHQPLLEVSAVNVTSATGADAVVTAGEGVTYTVDIQNNGQAPAYDVQIQDVLPAGLRVAGVTTQSIELLSGAALPVQASGFDPLTGLAQWDLDGAADAWTIPAGDTLRLVYTAQADADLGASLTLDNSVLVNLYFSFDNGDVPTDGDAAEREDYGPTAPLSASLTSPGAGALEKAITQPEAEIGVPFSYQIRVPAVAENIALSDVHVLDDLSSSAAVLAFSEARYSLDGGTSWAAMSNQGTATALDLVDQASGDGVDVPASEQMLVELTVYLQDDPANVAGLTFSNTARYSYGSFAGDTATLADTSEDMTIVEPSLVMTKDGSATLAYGTPGLFTLSVQNTDTAATARDITVTDYLPTLAEGGMCDVPPVVTDVSIYESDATTLVNTLAESTDYTLSFTPGEPCALVINGVSATAALGPEQILVVSYEAQLDQDTPTDANLTNFAAATQWFSAEDTSPARRTYDHDLQQVIEDVADPQDYHTLTPVLPSMQVDKTVSVQVDADGDGQASPGDTLRYVIDVTNTSAASLTGFSMVDDLGALNAGEWFEAGSLVMASLPPGSSDNSDPVGGTNGQGQVDIRDLNLAAQGEAGDAIQLAFDITLVAVMDDATEVLNQGQVEFLGNPLQLTDDPALGGTEDPTAITVNSAPQMRVQKVSADISADPAVLEPGETLRYTLTVTNIGNEDARDVFLRDAIPQYTSYLPGTTTLNGNPVADPAAGMSALESGMLVNAPVDAAPGVMLANTLAPADHVATVTFDVQVDSDAIPGTLIANQGFVVGTGNGGTDFMEQPSDDPATPALNDPTVDIVGNLPLLDVQKTVVLANDLNANNAPDPDDTLLYTFTVTNTADQPATNVMLTDLIPANTTYVPASTTLNGAAVADLSGASPLVSGMQVNSMGEVAGTVAANSTAEVTLQVTINTGTANGTVIVNQGTMSSEELPDELSDQDGIDSNGDQPTEITVGEAQQLAIVKNVVVVGGGAVMPGSELEYTVQVANVGTVPATQVIIQDDLSWLASMGTFVTNSATLNGGVAGVTEGTLLVADYGMAYGDLAPGANALLRFRVTLDSAIPWESIVSNTGDVYWNNNTQMASSTVDVQVGAIPGTATLSGALWHDEDFDNIFDATEQPLVDWEVQAWQNNVMLRSTVSGADGNYSVIGLPMTQPGETYELRFVAPGASSTTAPLGYTDSDPAFTDGLQVITDITAAADSLVADLNLPIDPNGVVYNAITREAIAGATLTMVDGAGNAIADSCFDSPAQQGQVTLVSGFYKFDLNFSGASCPSGQDYRIVVTPPAGAFTGGESAVIPPLTGEQTTAYDAAACSDDALATTAECEAQISAAVPPSSVAAGSPLTGYYLNLMFAGTTPEDSQIYNNHIPLDPELSGAVTITKSASVVNVSRGEFVPYVIRINNNFGSDLSDLAILDSFPAGFKYVKGSARLGDQAVEPEVDGRNLIWRDLDLNASGQYALKLLFIVGSGVAEGEYVNRAQVFQARTSRARLANSAAVSGEAQATVRVVPDPDFDCSDVIGKVYDDTNMNGYQDDGEAGLPNVRAVTARGLIVTSDQYGRFHITCAVVPNELRGSNFILKVDDRSLPSGYRMTTPNPLVRRATRGKMIKFNFGAALHRVVRLDIADPVFEKGSTEMRLQWASRMPLLMEQLEGKPSILRIAYMAEREDEGLVDDRLKAIRKRVARKWAELGNDNELVIETEVFWRTGAPLKGGGK